RPVDRDEGLPGLVVERALDVGGLRILRRVDAVVSDGPVEGLVGAELVRNCRAQRRLVVAAVAEDRRRFVGRGLRCRYGGIDRTGERQPKDNVFGQAVHDVPPRLVRCERREILGNTTQRGAVKAPGRLGRYYTSRAVRTTSPV